eukprot:CAMPEP_0203753688 /NCGR_PEP_ID=MMETSP0098-20131031/7417_1 /ASSEMBLY_ACC=CAM_ASM_000208 /TAXON_ID=96639 /ORGANISM=" , Strain NY0313808BC1" /LENGTH=60 /DNA_ID=CAMNT_0050644381 /DNA_START=491 /DNA_END=673 /DNA_ORIENTATION=-
MTTEPVHSGPPPGAYYEPKSGDSITKKCKKAFKSTKTKMSDKLNKKKRERELEEKRYKFE